MGTSKPYVSICRIGESITLPILSVHPDAQTAHDNAVRAALYAITEQAPHLLDQLLEVTVRELNDVAIREFLATLAEQRPDLMPAPKKTKRGRL